MGEPVAKRRGGRQKIELPIAPDDIFKRYESGEQLPSIAQSLGMSERTLYRRLQENETQWKIAQKAQAQQRYEVAKAKHIEAVANLEALKRQLDEEGITDAAARNWRLAHVIAIERACERMMNRAEWELERVDDRLYGKKQELSAQAPISISINLRGEAEVDITPGSHDAEQQSGSEVNIITSGKT